MAIPTRLAPIGRKWRKPYDSEVEYLASSGTQYIKFDTGFVGIDLTTSHVTASNGFYGIVGSWNGGTQANTVKYTTTQNRGWCVANNGSYDNVYSMKLTQTDKTRIVVNGTSVTISGTGYSLDFTMGKAWNYGTQSIYDFALFGCNYRGGNTVSCLAGRIYHCALYNSNGDMVHDLVPVVKSGIGYMYDRVSGHVFGNAGTGSFVVGPIRTTQEES